MFFTKIANVFVFLLFIVFLSSCNKAYNFKRADNLKQKTPTTTSTTSTTSTSTSTTSSSTSTTTTQITTTSTTTTSTTTSTTSTSTTTSSTTTSSSTTSSTTTSTSSSTTTSTTLISNTESIRFDYLKSKDSFHQEKFDKNHTSIVFKAYDDKGRTLPNLTENDIVVEENGVAVSNFILKSTTSVNMINADIVFSLDTTGSMQGDINAVKAAIQDFVSKLERNNIKANLCIVTFKDLVEKICNKFVEDDPATAANENLVAFLDELSKIKASGGGKPQENSLGGIVAAAKQTPWHTGAQRVIIHITDIEFWIQPINRSEAEARTAPTYDQVKDAMYSSKVMAFPITKKIHAYASDYFQHPSIPKMTNGQFFELKKVRDGKVSMDEIFDKIGQSLITTYVVEYDSEDNIGLNPTLPLSNRSIVISLKNPTQGSHTVLQSISSNMPNGRPEYKRHFTLSNTSSINLNTLEVFLNGTLINSGYTLNGSILEFAQPPAPNSDIEVFYEMGKLRDNVKVMPLILKGKGKLSNFKVWYNGTAAPGLHYSVSAISGGGWVFEPTDEAFVNSDPYMIRNNGYLGVTIEYLSER